MVSVTGCKVEQARDKLLRGCEANPASKNLQKELEKVSKIRDGMSRGKEQVEAGEYVEAKLTFGSLLQETAAVPVVLGSASADLGLGLTDSASRLTLQVIRADNRCVEGYYLRGRCMYLVGDFDNAVKLLREALRLDPDAHHAKLVVKKCRKVQKDVDAARLALYNRNFDQAVLHYTGALEKSQPLPIKARLYVILHTERAQAHIRIKNYQAALKDSNCAIYAQDDCVPAWLNKAKAYHGLARHQDALEELTHLMNNWGAGDEDIQRAYERAEFEVRKENRPDFYALFGVPSISSQMEIKKAYKVKAKELHPDRHHGKDVTEAQRKQAEENFKSLGEGLEILCDDFKRQLYDEGYDQKAIRERIEAAQQAAHRRQRGFHHHR